MQNDKELLPNLIGKQKECEFSLRFLLQKEKGSWKNFLTMLKLVKKGTRKEINYDYGEYVLRERLLGIPDGLKEISSLYARNGEKGKLVLTDYDEFGISSGGISRFVPSTPRPSIVRNHWPMRFCEFGIEGGQIGQRWNRELLKEKFPYYPDLSEAVISFFDLASEHFSSFGNVYVVIPDYRARVESLKLIFSRAEVTLDSPEIKFEDLVVKVFAKSGARITTLPDIYPESEVVQFDIGFQPDTLSAVLLSRQDNMKIDSKEFNKWSVEEEGIYVERPEEEILSLTKAGESQNLEYKPDILDDIKRNDFIESVVAFLNTNRGIILVGVDDNGNILGTTKNKEDLQKAIHDCVEPPPKDVKVDETLFSNTKIITVEVPEGDDKPYQSKRDKNWYVRHNGSDMRMERSELFQMLEKYVKREGTYPSY